MPAPLAQERGTEEDVVREIGIHGTAERPEVLNYEKQYVPCERGRSKAEDRREDWHVFKVTSATGKL